MKTPWEHTVYVENTPFLIDNLDADIIVRECGAAEIIVRQQKRKLMGMTDEAQRVTTLLQYLEGGDAESFHIFCEIIRTKMPGGAFREVLQRFATIDTFGQAQQSPVASSLPAPAMAPVPTYGSMQIGAAKLNLGTFVPRIAVYLDDTDKMEFARWTVSMAIPGKSDSTGVEHNVLLTYLGKHKHALSESNHWFDLHVAFHYLSNQCDGPAIDVINDRLAKLKHTFADKIFAAFSDPEMYVHEP